VVKYLNGRKKCVGEAVLLEVSLEIFASQERERNLHGYYRLRE